MNAPMPIREVDEHVLGADGQFDIHDEPVDISRYRFEDWIAFAIFWALALVVFYQFFTRYALNDSASWTEEIARYLLIATVFIGGAISVRKNNHILLHPRRNLMNSAGITNRIFNFALALVGWMKGGLGHVNVVGSMIFAGMSGTAIADAAGLGTTCASSGSTRCISGS